VYVKETVLGYKTSSPFPKNKNSLISLYHTDDYSFWVTDDADEISL